VTNKSRTFAALLTFSAVGLATWIASEGQTLKAVIPTRNDVPTIASGITNYEDGTPVKLTDPPITRQRAEALTRNVLSRDEVRYRASIADVPLFQAEYDVYFDFHEQFGRGNWLRSSMRRELKARQYAAACRALLLYRYSGGFDCSTPGNRVCSGVWSRQLKRYARCMEAQK